MIRYTITKKGDLCVHCNECNLSCAVSNECYHLNTVLGAPCWSKGKLKILCSGCAGKEPSGIFRKVANMKDIPLHRSEVFSHKAESDSPKKKRDITLRHSQTSSEEDSAHKKKDSKLKEQYPDIFCTEQDEYDEFMDDKKILCYCKSYSCPDSSYNYREMKDISKNYKFPIEYKFRTNFECSKTFEENTSNLEGFVSELFTYDTVADFVDKDIDFTYRGRNVYGVIRDVDILVATLPKKRGAAERVDRLDLYELLSGFEPTNYENIKFSILFSGYSPDLKGPIDGYTIDFAVRGHKFSAPKYECRIKLRVDALNANAQKTTQNTQKTTP